MEHEQLDKWCERVILGLVLAILGFTPLAFGGVPQAGWNFFVGVQWLTVGILAVWLLRFAINSKHRLLWPPVSWTVLAFMGYAVVRYVTADVEFLARQEVIKVLVYGVLYFAVVNNLHHKSTTEVLGVALVFIAMVISLYAIYQFISASDFVWQLDKPDGYRKRGSGTFISPNHLAGYLVMILPLSIALTLTGRFEALMKILLTYASVMIFAGVCVTVSRAGWLAMGVSMIALFVWLLRERDYWKRALSVLGVLVVVFGGFYWKADVGPERRDRIERARQLEDVRFQIWKPAFAMWKDHWLTGVGPAHFDTRFRAYRPATPELQARPERVHNDYLNTLVDWGLLGALIVVACWGIFFYQSVHVWKFVRRSHNDLGGKRSNKAAFVAGGSMGLLGMLVHAFFDFNMHIPASAIVMVTLLGIIASHYRFAGETHWHTVRLPLRIPVNLALLALLGYLGWQTWRGTQETLALVRSHRAANADAQLAALKAAHAAQSANSETTTAIGNLLLDRSQQGTEGYRAAAEEAIGWFEKTAALNPFTPHALIGKGRCLDWLARHDEAGAAFTAAERLDPNGYLVAAYMGWHHFQTEQFDLSRQALEKSLKLMSDEKVNPIPHSYLKSIAERLKAPGQ